MNPLAACEALLFVAGDEGIALPELAAVLEVEPVSVRYQLWALREELEHDSSSALTVARYHERYYLVTKQALGALLETYATSPFATHLSKAALETLAMVAYNEPVTRLTIDAIRGVKSSAMLKKLVQYQLITEVGRENSPGQPILYGLTDYFYQYFNLASKDELPDLTALVKDLQADRDLYNRDTDD